jgi:hypothetical protein
MGYYRHTQFGWLIMGIAVYFALIAVIVFPPATFGAGPSVLLACVTLALLLFVAMTVTVDQKHVALRFGVGLIRKRIALDEIQAYRSVRNPWYYGWGIHLVPGGTLYNVSGLSAVDLTLAGGRHVLIGTDEPQALLAALRQVLGEAPRPSVEGADKDHRLARNLAVACAVIVAAIPLAVGALIHMQMQPPTVKVSRELFSVRCAPYGAEIPITEITGVSMETALPRIRVRTNGFAMRGSLRGHFRLDELGGGQLFVELGTPPYVVVRTRRDFVIVNFKDPASTRGLYANLVQYVGQK